MMITADRAFFDVLSRRLECARFGRRRSTLPADAIHEEVSLFTAGNDYANEWVMLRTNDRELRGVPATGRSFRVRGASIGRLDAST
jgi:hypothetical protein